MPLCTWTVVHHRGFQLGVLKKKFEYNITPKPIYLAASLASSMYPYRYLKKTGHHGNRSGSPW